MDVHVQCPGTLPTKLIRQFLFATTGWRTLYCYYHLISLYIYLIPYFLTYLLTHFTLGMVLASVQYSSQCSTTGVIKAVVCVILSVG